MGWGGVDLIRRFPGETPEQAVERVYEGGLEIIVDEGQPMMRVIPGPEGDSRGFVEDRKWMQVSVQERKWMLRAMDSLNQVTRDWEIVEQDKEPGRRWPWSIVLAQTSGSVIAFVGKDHINLKLSSGFATYDDWLIWWRIVCRFVREGCVVYEPDQDLIVKVATSFSAKQARDRYGWV